MKKTLKIILSLVLFFSFSLCASSQSSQKNLDQVKLAKQFLGSWITEIGKDSIIYMEAVPSGKGLYCRLEWKSNGKTYATASIILGFTEHYESVVMYDIWQAGIVGKDIGKFVSPKKLVMERFKSEQTQSTDILEVEFPTPDTYTWRMLWKGMDETWEPFETYKWTFTRVKE